MANVQAAGWIGGSLALVVFGLPFVAPPPPFPVLAWLLFFGKAAGVVYGESVGLQFGAAAMEYNGYTFALG